MDESKFEQFEGIRVLCGCRGDAEDVSGWKEHLILLLAGAQERVNNENKNKSYLIGLETGPIVD